MNSTGARGLDQVPTGPRPCRRTVHGDEHDESPERDEEPRHLRRSTARMEARRSGFGRDPRPGGGGLASHYWIGTTRPDGRPHLAGVGIVWDDGKFYLSTGAGTQKGRNLAHDPRCTVSIAAPGIDIVAEGEAKIIRDEGELQRIATDLFGGWGPQVRDGAFWHEFSAPSAGPPPWDVTRSLRRRSSRWRRSSRTAPPAGGSNSALSRPHGIERSGAGQRMRRTRRSRRRSARRGSRTRGASGSRRAHHRRPCPPTRRGRAR